MIRFLLDQIKESVVRDNFKKISEYLRSQTLLKADFKFFEYTFDAAAANLSVPHGLRYVPKDIIQLSTTNGITVTWHYGNFDKTNIEISASGAGTVRAFIGLYGRESNG